MRINLSALHFRDLSSNESSVMKLKRAADQLLNMHNPRRGNTALIVFGGLMAVMTIAVIAWLLLSRTPPEQQAPQPQAKSKTPPIQPAKPAPAQTAKTAEKAKTPAPAKPARPKEDWVKFESKKDGFRVELPADPLPPLKNEPTLPGASEDRKTKSSRFTVSTGTMRMSADIEVVHYPGVPEYYDDSSQQELDRRMRDKPSEGIFTDITHQQYRGRQYVKKSEKSSRIERGFVVGNRMYYISVYWDPAIKNNDASAKRLIDSFTITYVPPKRKNIESPLFPVDELRATNVFAKLAGVESKVLEQNVVCVCGVFPFARQMREYDKAMKAAGFTIDKPPALAIFDVIIERSEVAGKEPSENADDWKKIDTQAYVKFLRNSIGEFAPERSLEVKKLATDPHLTSPLPKRIDAKWGPEVGHPRLADGLRQFKQNKDWKRLLTGPKSILAPDWDAEKHAQLEAKRPYILVRYFDFFVKENHNYRYRVSIVCRTSVPKPGKMTIPAGKPSPAVYVKPRAK